MTKMIVAAVMACAFLISMPVRAEDKGDEKGAPAEKAVKKDKKKAEDQKNEKKPEKAGGGW
jgi:sugar phosphate permease